MAAQSLNITALQLNLKWNDAEFNRSQAEALIHNSGNTDLYVLPEMFSTGFITEPCNDCEGENGETLEWMKRMASATGAALTGSVAIKTRFGDYRNRMYFVKPTGEYLHYDKHHLFTYGNEHLHYSAGEERVIVTLNNVRIMLQVCYDLRFPCFSRNKNIYDICVYVANWPQSRRNAWDTLLRARAIENQCYVVGVNRIGDDINCHYNGGTTVIDPYGKDLVTAKDDEMCIITSHLDIKRLNLFREKFPVLRDAD